MMTDMSIPYMVYMVRCSDNSLYTGYTSNLSRRIKEHNAGTASKYTRSRLPVTLAFHIGVMTKPMALQVEYKIKQLTKAEKEAIVSGDREVPI